MALIYDHKPHTAAATCCVQTRPQPKLALTDFGLQSYVALICRLMVSTPRNAVIAWVTTHLPTPEGWKAELA